MAADPIGRPNLEHHRKRAKALLKSARTGAPDAVERLTRLHPAPWRLADAQRAIAQDAGHASWPKLKASVEAAQPTVHLAPGQAWRTALDRIARTRAPSLALVGTATDAALADLAGLTHLRRLDLSWSRGVTDAGVRHLAGLTGLTALDLSGTGLTDAGVDALAGMSGLQRLSVQHTHVTDAGLARLGHLRRLHALSAIGTFTGDATIRAFAGCPELDDLELGDGVTDAGLAALADYPAFARWRDVRPRFDILSNHTGLPRVWLNLRSAVTDAGLAALARLDGLAQVELFASAHFGSFFAPQSRVSAAGIAALGRMPHLLALGVAATRADDDALATIARLPHLRYLSIQENVATTAGFRALADSPALEHLWAMRCQRAGGSAWGAVAGIRTLRRLALDAPLDLDALAGHPLTDLVPANATSLAAIRRMPALRGLHCMFCDDLDDAAFAELAGTPLTTVRVFGTKLTDAGLAHLADLPALTSLHLEGCAITDVGVRHLARSPLRELIVRDCGGVTRSVVRELPPRIRVEL